MTAIGSSSPQYEVGIGVTATEGAGVTAPQKPQVASQVCGYVQFGESEQRNLSHTPSNWMTSLHVWLNDARARSLSSWQAGVGIEDTDGAGDTVGGAESQKPQVPSQVFEYGQVGQK